MRFLPIALLALTACAQSPVAQTYRPTPTPDRVVLTWHGDPKTSMSVTWRTDLSVIKGIGQIAVADDGPDFVKSATEVAAESQRYNTNNGEAMAHSARFTGLTPSTVYAYRVGNGTNWSEWNQFKTASEKPEPVTFLYSGDAQVNIFAHWSRAIRTGFRAAPNAQFIVHAGDLVNRGNRDEEWGEWFEAAGWINRSVVCFPTPGNHEYSSVLGQRGLTEHWRAQFDLPLNGVEGLEEQNYYADFQGVRMISMNSNEKFEEQAAWLEKLLSSNPNKWTVMTFHHPVYSTKSTRDNAEMRNLWQPVIDRYGVDLVLTGHDHTYARSNLMSGVNTRTGKSGTVYVVSVGGPKMYPVDRQPWMTRVAQDTQLVQVIHIDGDKLTYEALTPTGRLYDAFELHKRVGRANRMIDKAPKTPERVPAPAQTRGPSGQ